ncbi:L-threonylcarbamoyladenylate synthase [Hyphococcus sp.]|uniref:L-threonylcarbamoyladenylate synthase n=1 Tax=Hyphococcus sp. TaxID=2038636 RepID=UPI003CCBDA3B
MTGNENNNGQAVLADMKRAIKSAAKRICAGDLVAMPTETVYGLAADATDDTAVARIFEAKARPQFNPLIVHVAGVEMAQRYADFSPLALQLAQAFWPGPLTLVLPRRAGGGLSLLVGAGLDTVGLRMPDHQLARQLIETAGRPLAAPSANRSGTVSPTTAAHVRRSLGRDVDMIVDGGPCPVGVESTIIRIDGERATLLRPGGLPRSDIERVTGAPLENAAGGSIEAPGMMTSHYAPSVTVRLNARAQNAGEAFLGFGAVSGARHALNLSPGGDLREAAGNLFAHLRLLDDLCTEHALHTIAAAPIPMEGLGEAINDRLQRAAAPR